MDYDDNDFQSQNLQLAGEGSSKFPPALRPYALPKFDFDDNLHGTLRFDNLVETEIFLDIENNEDNQWIEDFSRGTSGIQFNSSAAQSCSIPRHNNVWSEATSSESVEMLLKSVGQEEITPAQSTTKETDPCDELGCIIKQMESTSKQDNDTFSAARDGSDLPSALLPREILENFNVVNNDAGEQQPQLEDTSRIIKAEASLDGGVVNINPISIEVDLPDSERSLIIDGKSKVKPSANVTPDKSTEEGAASGFPVDSAVASVEIMSTSNDELNKDAPQRASKNPDESVDVSGKFNSVQQEKRSVLSQEAEIDDQIVDAKVVECGTSNFEIPLHPSSAESAEEVNTIEANLTNVEGPSMVPEGNSEPEDLKSGDQSTVNACEGAPEVKEGNTTFESHEVDKLIVSQLEDKNLKSGASLLSAEDGEPPTEKADGSGTNYVDDDSRLTLKSSSAESFSKMDAEGHVSSAMIPDSTQKDERQITPVTGDVQECHQDVLLDEKENTQLPSDSSNMQSEVVRSIVVDRGEAFTQNRSTVSKSELHAIDHETDGVSSHTGSGITSIAISEHQTLVPSLPVSGLTQVNGEEATAPNITVEASLTETKESSQVSIGLDSFRESEKGSSVADGPTSTHLSPLLVDACNTESQNKPQAAVIANTIQENAQVQVCPVPCDSTLEKVDGSEAAVKEYCGKTSLEVSEHGANPADIVKPASVSDTGNKTADRSKNEPHKDGDKPLANQIGSVPEITSGDATKGLDAEQKHASKFERNFTSQDSSVAGLHEKEASSKGQPLLTIQENKVPPIVGGSPSTSGLVQSDMKVAKDLPHGSAKLPGAVTTRSTSKGSSERKTRRASSKATGKETARKGTAVKDATSGLNVTMSPSGISQLLQSNEMQRYGHVDFNVAKPFVLSTSGLPDLNSSTSTSVFQQPFTDLQQVQLRAQIFVYGALIQGAAPDEAYMISAFGGPDGGRSNWENAWRSCIERLQGQKSHLATPETPLPSRPNVKSSDQAAKLNSLQSKAISSSVGRPSNKGIPLTTASPMVPFSSPLWGMVTPCTDTLQPSVMPRGPVMDFQRALSPLNAHQTPPLRNFVGHNSSWISQAPFCAPWVASPQTAALDTVGRFSAQLPTENVHLTPVKESPMPNSSGVKHVSSGPMVHSSASASVLAGPSPVPDTNKGLASSNQPSGDARSRKRKKTSVLETPVKNTFQIQLQTESIPAPLVTSYTSTSSAAVAASDPSTSCVPVFASHSSTPNVITTPMGFVSKAAIEKFVAPVSPSSSCLRKGDNKVEHKSILSDETLDKVKEARVQAEDAAASAAAAVSHGQEIWNQLDKQRKSGLGPDIETKLASAAVAIAAAAAVAKAAAAAANVASNAALQAKLMAEEALVSGSNNSPSHSSVISFSAGMKNLGKATPASILKGDGGTSSSSSILLVAREAARRRVEAASAASKRAENMDAIVKAAELAAEAVSQAGKIVAMGDSLQLNELVAAGPEGYWKVANLYSELVFRPNDASRDSLHVDTVGEGRDACASQSREDQNANLGKSPISREISSEDHLRLVDGVSGSAAVSAKDAKAEKGRKVSDLTKTIGVVPESENGSKSSETLPNEHDKGAETSKGNDIKEGSLVEVFKEGSGLKAAWFTANVLSLKDGKAYVSYTELTLGEGPEKVREWVALEGERDEAPKIRVARPVTAMPFEGTRKRRRAAMGDYTWSVGDRVDAWIQDSWWEGVVTEKDKKDDTMLTVRFPVQGETSVVRAWHLRPSLMWKDGGWAEWSSSRDNRSHGDTPNEKRPRVRSPLVEAKGKDKSSKSIDAVEPHKSDDPTLLDLTADQKIFNIGRRTRNENKPETHRVTRTGLQKEGSRVVFGVPKPGKKRKFMEVSKHFGDRGEKIDEPDDSVKFAKYLMPQGSGSRALKNTFRTEINEKRVATSKPRVPKSGKAQNVSDRTIPQKGPSSVTAVSAPDSGAAIDSIAKTKDSLSQVENTSGKQNVMDTRSSSGTGRAAEGPIAFSSATLPSDTHPSKKISVTNAKSERASKGKLAPAGGKLAKIEEDKVSNSSSVRSTLDVIEPRRSNRRIQPTSRLLEGLQTSLMVSKFPAASHDKSHKNKSASRGNNQG